MRQFVPGDDLSVTQARLWLALRGFAASAQWLRQVEAAGLFRARRSRSGRRVFTEAELCQLLEIGRARRARRAATLRPVAGAR